jgi:hypothetical protein
VLCGKDGCEVENAKGFFRAGVTAAVLSVFGSDGFEKEKGELAGLNSADGAVVVAAGVSVFWVTSTGLEKEKGDAAAKGFVPAGGTETEALENTDVGLSAAEDTGGKTLGFESADGAAGANGVAAGVCA